MSRGDSGDSDRCWGLLLITPTLALDFSHLPRETGTIIIPTFQRRTLRLREVK